MKISALKILELNQKHNLLKDLAERELQNPEGVGVDLRLGALFKIVKGGAFIEVDGKEILILSRDLTKFLAQQKREHTAKWNPRPQRRNLGCPVGEEGVELHDGTVFDKSGIHDVAQALMPFVTYHYDNPPIVVSDWDF